MKKMVHNLVLFSDWHCSSGHPCKLLFSPVATDLQLNYNQIPLKVEVGENDELKLYIEKCYH